MSPKRSRAKRRRAALAAAAPAREPRARQPEAAPARPRRQLLKAVTPFLPGALVVVVLVLGVAGYLLFIPLTVTHDQLLSRLLPAKSTLPNVAAAPAFSAPVPIPSNAPAALSAAATNDEQHTGSYAIQWFGAGSVGANEDLAVYLTPSASLASATAAWQVEENVAKGAITAAKQTFVSAFTLPSLNGRGAFYRIPRTVQNSTGQPVPAGTTEGYTVVLSEGRAVVRETVQGAKVTRPEVVALASEIHGLLVAKLPGFPVLANTAYPLLASIYYAIGGVAVLAAAIFTPLFYRSRRSRRLEREAERARSHYRSRGSRQLKRYRKLI